MAGVVALALALTWLRGSSLTIGLAALLTSVVWMTAFTLALQRERRTSAVSAQAQSGRGQAIIRQELDQRLDVQRQLRETEARLRAIIESAPVTLFAVDLEGVITFCVGVGPDPFGGEARREASGWSALELLADQPDAIRAIRDALSGERAQIDLRREERTFALRLGPFRDAAGRTAGAIAVASDVTDRRRDEAILRQTLAALREADGERRALLGRLVDAQEQERRRIAADIHDDSIQTIFAVAVRLLSLRSSLKDPAQVQLLDRLQVAVQQASDRLRHLIFELRPLTLDEGGLAAALRESLVAMQEETGIAVELTASGEAHPATDLEVIAFRIAQEALSNIRKHARAQHVQCVVATDSQGVLIDVKDDGVGFNGEAPRPSSRGHLGIVAMRERAELAGGWLRITGSEGAGCHVECWIPNHAQAVANAA
ncbi:MAG TPA: PAS domain-containing protein [Candidatus Dormibacteraeota bacterium]|nr:PAS domain-containing protein [Candidatus Dormibacteraeota bacterium]